MGSFGFSRIFVASPPPPSNFVPVGDRRGQQIFESPHQKFREKYRGGGGEGHLYFRLNIILIKGLTKHTEHIFSGMKINPKYAFLHAFSLICPSCPFQNLPLWPKTHPFFPNFARFCTPKWCTRVHCLVLKNNPNYVNFYEDDIQLGGGSTYGPNRHQPPFWQINHANSAYFRLFLGYFGVISTIRPPFLDLAPPPFYISWIRPCNFKYKWPPGKLRQSPSPDRKWQSM